MNSFAYAFDYAMAAWLGSLPADLSFDVSPNYVVRIEVWQVCLYTKDGTLVHCEDADVYWGNPNLTEFEKKENSDRLRAAVAKIMNFYSNLKGS